MSALDGLRLVAITDLDRFDPDTLVARWQTLAQQARPGSVAIDLRAPGRPARALFEIGERLKKIAASHRQLLIVNDRIDLALLLEADALHLREDSVDTQSARRLVADLPILRACHRVGDAPLLEADAVVLSPVIEERKGNPALGLAALRSAKSAIREAGKATRLIALGGVDSANAPSCLAAGADTVAAVAGALADSPIPLLRALGVER